MDRRRGVESIFGIGGGLTSKEFERNLDIARDYSQRNKPDQALPYILKALEDPYNLEASIEFSAYAPNAAERIKTLEEAAERGKRILLQKLGPKAFDDDGDSVGHFWGLLETRPYMRVLNALLEMYFQANETAKSADMGIEMLRLCPGDNMGIRSKLGSALIRDGRYGDALSFAQAWSTKSTMDTGMPPKRGGTLFKKPTNKALSAAEEERLSDRWSSGELMHTAALASFKLFGDCELLRQYLRIASKVNPYILVRILGNIRRPNTLLLIRVASRSFLIFGVFS
ncbi:hypothetical protein D9611_000722 [Ephemerocybe angulata]|uniref:Uncharacterized protein n=1 Tax=Ephemerocybe angulata TaxID=980116 RepID=A0A8H5BMU5_9AGAR|nr:hypothetical protein D9611_000722 [Tulosesus angulatus]